MKKRLQKQQVSSSETYQYQSHVVSGIIVHQIVLVIYHIIIMYYWMWRSYYWRFLFRIALWILAYIIYFCIINVSSYGNKDLSLCADWSKWNATGVPKSQMSSQQLTNFVRHYYPRQRSYSQPSGSFFEKFGKPTLFTFGGIAGTYTIKWFSL